MRPLTDLLYVSREKLAFIVDATAAPIASIVPVSSWVGFEVGLIQAEIDRKLETMSAVNYLSLGASCSHMLHACHFVTRCQVWPLSRAGWRT
jgi:Na+/H+ antiporter NhaC